MESTGWALRRLEGTWLFKDLPRSALVQLASGATERELGANEVLLREGEPGDAMYVVMSGVLAVTQRGEDGREVLLGEVRRGEHLGELALLGNAPRTATATASEQTRVLRVTREGFEACVAQHPAASTTFARLSEYRRAWSKVRRTRPPASEVRAALERFIPDAPAQVASEVEWVTLPKGALLFRQHEVGDAVYFLVSGALSVFAHRDDGNEVRVGDVSPGESVGEMALLTGEGRMASARAEADCELLKLSRQGFDDLLTHHPKAMATFARSMAARLAQAARGRSALAQLRGAPFVTLEECAHAVSLPDPVLLNLTITQLYHRVSVDLTVLLGAQDVNWFGFACRASKTAGASIRGEELPLRALLTRTPLWGLLERGASATRRMALIRRFDDTLTTVGDRVAAGNRFIFEEIGPAFVQFVHTFVRDEHFERSRLEPFLARFRSGPSADGGQETLKGALAAYYEAAFEQRPKRRAELILLGSLKIGLHEQIRVGPIIDAALDAPLEVFFDDTLAELPRPLRAIAARGRPMVQRQLRRLITQRMLRMRLPDVELELGEDVPPWGTRRDWRPMLETLELPELSQLFESLAGGPVSAAHDWTVLADRMRYIATLFRVRQKSLQLFEPPYLEAQAASIRARRVPLGAL